jgi:uncharacterized membrane protein
VTKLVSIIWPYLAAATVAGIAAWLLLLPPGDLVPATVSRVVFTEMVELPNRVQAIGSQIVEVEADAGRLIRINHGGEPLVVGDRVLLESIGADAYSVADRDRRGALAGTILAFAVAVVICGGARGARSLIALAFSVFGLALGYAPLVLAGAPPVLTSVAFAAIVLLLAMATSGGLRRETWVAYLSTLVSVVATAAFAAAASAAARLSGQGDDAALYLNVAGHNLDFVGLFLGATIVGVVGILDDVAVTQVAVVSDLLASGASRRESFRRALSVGREHAASLVNTLVLAYAGSALPLFLLAYADPSPWGALLSREVFAAEIVRSAAGTAGLALCVPVATALAVWLLRPGKGAKPFGHACGHRH